jgi:hypothetical protein
MHLDFALLALLEHWLWKALDCLGDGSLPVLSSASFGTRSGRTKMDG